MAMSVDLPVVRLEPPRARMATTGDVLKDAVMKYPRSVETSWNALSHGHASDQKMAQLSDSLRTLSVALIAGLGSLGVSQTGGFLPFVLGGLSWLGAMKITPMVNNTLAYLKTGVNQNKFYVTSNNDVRPLFQDPGFLPMQVIDKNMRLHWADHLGINRDNPDRPALLKDKLKQITIQVHTWWMLAAGFATPILSALICDRLETPLRNMMIQRKVSQAQKAFQKALASGNAGELTQATSRYVHAVVGLGTDVSPVAKWWGEMQRSMGTILNLKAVDAQKLIHGSEEVKFEALSKHLHQHLSSEPVRLKLTETINSIQSDLYRVIRPIEQLLDEGTAPKKLDPKVLSELKALVASAKEPAEATLLHLKKLTQHKPHLSQLKATMETPVIANFERLFSLAHYHEAEKLAGSRSQFEASVKALGKENQQFSRAFRLMGASPKDLLTNVGRSMALRGQWMRRYPIGIGGTVLLGSVLFHTFMLGEDFGAPSTSAGGSSE